MFLGLSYLQVDKVLSASGFAYSAASSAAGGVSGARVLSGSEEGLLGWVALNYASGALQVSSNSNKRTSSHKNTCALLVESGNTAGEQHCSVNNYCTDQYGRVTHLWVL